MVALTCDFQIVTSRVPTRFSAVFFSIRCIAKAWDVRALFRLLIRHYNFILSSLSSIKKNTATVDVAPLSCTDVRDLGGVHSRRPVFGDYVISDDCMQISKRRLPLSHMFPKWSGHLWKKNDCPQCQQADRSVRMRTVPRWYPSSSRLRASVSAMPYRADDAM